MSTNLELPLAFIDVHPESEEYIAACLTYDTEYERLRAQEAESGTRLSLAEYMSVEATKNDAVAKYSAQVRAVNEKVTADDRRDLAGRMIAKILQHGTVIPARGPSYAVIQQVKYYGTTTIEGQDYFWGAKLKTWHHQPPDGSEMRVLSYDEHVACEEAMLQRFPKASAGQFITSMTTHLSTEGYPDPERHQNAEETYNLLRVATNTIDAATNHTMLRSKYPMVAIPLTPERLTQIGEFIDTLQPLEDSVQSVSGNQS